MMHLTRFSTPIVYLLSISNVRKSVVITFDDVESTFDTLQTWYNQDHGLWVSSTGWWNSANCLTMLAKYATINDRIDEWTKDLWQDVFTKAPRYNAGMAQAIGSLWRMGQPSIPRTLSLARHWKKAQDAENIGFINDYYDDEGWWALAWIAVYDHTQDQKYLDAAVSIFEDMHAAFNTTPLGGIWWDKDKHISMLLQMSSTSP